MSAHDQQAGATRLPILALIESVRRACQAGVSPDVFVAEVLRGFVSLADAPYGAFWRPGQTAGELVLSAELAPGVAQAAARAWSAVLREIAAGVIQQAIIRYQPVSEPAGQLLTGQKYVALGFPVRGDRDCAGAITIVIREGSAVLSDAGLAMLRLLADSGLLYTAARAAARFEGSYKSLSGAWGIVGEMLAFHKPLEMAQVLANRTRVTFGADRASLGFVSGQKVAVVAISGEDVLDTRSNVVRLLQAAQAEVVVSGEAGLFFATADGEQRAAQTARSPQHERLARERSIGAVYSLPLRKADKLVAVWTLEFSAAEALSEELRRVLDVAAGQMGPLFDLARCNARGPLERGRDGAEEAARWTFGRDHPWRKAAAAAILAVLAYAVFGRADFNAAGNCVLRPALRRVYSAPFDTTVRAALVEPGDTVSEGQLLVEFDRDQIEMQLREARSNLISTQKEMATYLVGQRMPQYAEAEAHADALAAEVELLERRLERASLRADFPGIVLTGDLKQDVGRPVRMGEQLLELAPLDSLLLEVEVAQGDVAYLQVGQQGRFSTKAHPGAGIRFTVEKIRPTPDVRGGASVYIAEAAVANPEGWLRPGMEGAAKVRIGRRNVTWVHSRKLLDWLRLRLWMWGK